MKLASFDIFDTTLIRRCGLPENIFYLLAQKLYPDNPAKRDDFFLWRCDAERQAVSTKKNKNITLTDIYDNSEIDSFVEYTVSELISKEKEIERENLMPNPAVLQLIAKKRAQGFVICFISDMYLDSRFLSDILRESGCLFEDEQVFVSCEQNARKSDGKLFDKVRQRLNPESWQHFGDNRHSDVKMPRKKGIQASAIYTNFTGMEKRILSKSKEFRQPCEMSILAGWSRAARIRNNNNPFSVIAADYVAPVYIPYVKFILEEAHQHGIKKLFFLSRDSYVLLKSAQKMSAKYADIEIKYLFVSRKSLMLPYLTDMNKDTFLAALDKNTVMRKNVASLLSLLNIDNKILEIHNIDFPYKKITTREQETDFLNKIFYSPLSPILRQNALMKHTILMEYFKQEGVLDKKKSAMVDVGWLGTSRLMINSILKKSGYDEILFFYYGVRKDVFHSRYGNYITYLKPQQSNSEATFLIEDYFSASPYPTTLGYTQTSTGQVVPIFPDGEKIEKNPVVKFNVDIIEWISNLFNHTNIDNETLLFKWTTLAFNNIISLSDKIDLTPFVTNDSLGIKGIIRELTPKELLEVVLLGKSKTLFDKASIQLTLGYNIMSLLDPLRCFTGKIRRYLFLKYIK